MSKWCILLLCAAPTVFGQTELDRLVAESVRLRDLTPAGEYSQDHFAKVTRSDWMNLEHALRDWVESRLPANTPALDRNYPGLETQMTAELLRAGVLEPKKLNAEAGYISSVKLSRPTEYPGALLVATAITVPCGADSSIYIYRFTTGGRSRILETDGNSEYQYGTGLSDTLFSTPDRSGGRLFYASWYGVQCGSVWDSLDYKVFRIDAGSGRAVPVLSASHDFVDYESRVKLTAGELLLELTAEALEAGFRRTYVMHYGIGADGAQRIDPVALRPQDFVHEWMIRPWGEM